VPNYNPISERTPRIEAASLGFPDECDREHACQTMIWQMSSTLTAATYDPIAAIAAPARCWVRLFMGAFSGKRLGNRKSDPAVDPFTSATLPSEFQIYTVLRKTSSAPF
jgi:hypothetical protein